ncbi:MAG: FtsQ-type POTRA domain-containing protein [Verrucomicrobia bacterium]|nr:FtsQ-type POTRA domain-containing protein [Verrucomicrobiota bacterium]
MLGTSPKHVPPVARTATLRHLELKTSAGGVLDQAWLERTLALPRNAALMELDLDQLCARLLAESQVVSASITRHFPDRLTVRLTERVPVARVRVELGGTPRDLLVDPQGVIFHGVGFEPALLDSLPWLSGLTLAPDGAGFQPIAGMAPVAQLLADAQFSALRLYRAWQSVSLARLASDREIEVTTKNGTIVVFSARGDYFVQLATLDYLIERLADTPMTRARIDLTLGRNVPVMIEPPAPAESGAAPRPASVISLPSPTRPNLGKST